MAEHLMTDPIDLDRFTDFTPEQQARASAWVEAELAERPARRGDAFLVLADPDEWPSRTTITALTGWLHANGLHRTARQVERSHVPDGYVLLLLLGDEVRVRVVQAEVFAPEDVPVGASALGVLGLLAGGAR